MSVAHLEGQLECVVRFPYARVEAVPSGIHRTSVDVVDHLRVYVEVQEVRRVDELEIWKGRRALLLHPRIERFPDRTMRPLVLAAKLHPRDVVVAPEAGVGRGYVRPPDLEWVARDDPHEGQPRCHQGWKANHVV